MNKNHERIGIKISVVGGAFLAVSAIVMSLIAKSQAILLDGLYNFITLTMAFLSLKAINVIEAPETKHRPFGYMALEPFLNLTKSLVILTLLVVFLVTNIQELCTGGRIISLDMTTIYIFICLIIYGIIIMFLRKYKKGANSNILNVEVRNWYVDALLTAGIAISLVIATVIYRMGYVEILPYIDPIIVILLVVLSLPVPLKAFIMAVRRLLLVSSENRIEDEVKDCLSGVIDRHGLLNMQVWGLKSGRTHYLFIYAGLKEEETRVSHLDAIRVEIFNELSKIYSQFWADIIFTEIDPDEHFSTVVALNNNVE